MHAQAVVSRAAPPIAFRPDLAPQGGSQGSDVLASSLDSLSTRLTFERNEEIFGEGEPADHLYKVTRGTVRTFRMLDDGRRQVVAFHLAGDVFGLETGGTHRLSAEAVDLVQVQSISRSGLLQRVARDSRLAHLLWTLTSRELEATREGLLRFQHTAQERVAGFLLEMSARQGGTDSVDLAMTRQDIADHLTLTIETVSRTLTALTEQGIVDLPSRRRVHLVKRAALSRLYA